MSNGACQYETVAWGAMTTDDRRAWRIFQAVRPSLRGPYFSLEWHDAIEAARGDLQVARVWDRGEIAGFLPFHRGRLGALRPAGGPLSDHHGLIGRAGLALDAETLVAGLQARTFRFTGAPADDPAFARFSRAADAFALDLSFGYAAYVERRRRAEPKAFRNLRARLRRLEGREVVFRADDRDPEALADLIEMKSRQYRRTKQIDVFAPAWTRRLVDILFHSRAPGLRGRLSTLRIDGRVVAAHFGIQTDEVLHYWFTAFDEAEAACSPGLILLQRVAEAVAAEGVRRIDLGGGPYRFKREFADLRLPMGEGVVRGRSLLATASRGAAAVTRGFAVLPLGSAATLPHRALRRLDRLISFHEPRAALAAASLRG